MLYALRPSCRRCARQAASFQSGVVADANMDAVTANAYNAVAGVSSLFNQTDQNTQGLATQAGVNQNMTTTRVQGLASKLQTGQAQVVDGIGRVIGLLAANQAALTAKLTSVTAQLAQLKAAQAEFRARMLERFCETTNELQVELKYLRRLMLMPEGNRPYSKNATIHATDACTPLFSWGFCTDPAEAYTSIKTADENCAASGPY